MEALSDSNADAAGWWLSGITLGCFSQYLLASMSLSRHLAVSYSVIQTFNYYFGTLWEVAAPSWQRGKKLLIRCACFFACQHILSPAVLLQAHLTSKLEKRRRTLAHHLWKVAGSLWYVCVECGQKLTSVHVPFQFIMSCQEQEKIIIFVRLTRSFPQKEILWWGNVIAIHKTFSHMRCWTFTSCS